MPTLDWIGKEAVVNHHTEVPYHLLHEDGDLSIGDTGAGNLLVEGDNLKALKALLPYYAGQVKCIYIDPPYNTGEQKWTYNDRVASPEIAGWLGRVVGGETEDLSRHDKWLCMMYPRLRLLVEFMRDDGFLLVSLNDEGEIARFRIMMDELLPNGYVCSFVWKARRNLDNRSAHNVSVDHEYVLAYRGPNGRVRGAEIDTTKYSNPDNDPRGPWSSDNLVGLATADRRPNLHYALVNPETGRTYPCPRKGWRYSRETMSALIAEGRILWPKAPTGRPRLKRFLNELQNEYAGFSSIITCGNTNEGTEELQQILGSDAFMFPKPRSLVQQLVAQTTSCDDLIVDSFAGSGTTGHAVLAQNAEDGGNRRFILVELEPHIAGPVTRERLKRVIEGYTYTKASGAEETVAGLGGGFRYCRLGEPLYDEQGRIAPAVTWDDLARMVYFLEAGTPLQTGASPPFVGVCRATAVYLLFNGTLKDRRPNGGNVLTSALLASLPPHDGPRVVYGVGCRLGAARLKREGVVFKQIPYQLRVE